jgi:hypothetical protein
MIIDMYLANYGFFLTYWLGSGLKQNIIIIYLLDHLVRQKIINICYCIIWWSPNESFSLIFQLPNGQLLILNF